MYGTCKPTALSVNHAGAHSKDCFRGAAFVDTLAGKLDMWLCMAEPVQVNLSKMELGGDTYLRLHSLHLYVLCDFSLPFTSVYILLSLSHTKLPPTSTITRTSLLLSSHFLPSPFLSPCSSSTAPLDCSC